MLRSLVAAGPRGRTLVVAFVLYGLATEVMFGPWPGLVRQVRDRCAGLNVLDVRGFWSAQDAQALVRACGTGGRAAYVELALADIFYPAIGGAALLLGSAALLHRYGPGTWPLLVPAIAMTALDYAENIAVWTLLGRWPHVDGVVVTIGGPVSAAKQVSGFLAHAILLVLLTVAVVRTIRVGRRGRQPDSIDRCDRNRKERGDAMAL